MAIGYLRLFAKRYKSFWLLYLALALVSVQSINVHLDVYDHQHHADEQITSAHADHNSTHVCGVTCDSSHDHKSITELDIAPEGVVKNLSFGSLILALLSSVIAIFLIQLQCTRTFHRRDVNILPWWQTALRPPLRAPPI